MVMWTDLPSWNSASKQKSMKRTTSEVRPDPAPQQSPEENQGRESDGRVARMTAPGPNPSIPSRGDRAIVRDAALNAAGLGLPLLAAVVCIPPLIEGLGTARFGVLTLIWAISSYFGLFDLGLGRVLTQQVAVAVELREQHRIGRLVGTSMALLTMLGVVAGVILWLGAEPIATLLRGQPDAGETTRAVTAMAVAMPAVIATSGLRGILEARRSFLAVNAIRLPFGLLTFVGPLAVVMLTEPRLDWIAWVLCAGRWIGALAHLAAVTFSTPAGTGRLTFDRELVRTLTVSGGWMSVSNVISPLMGYADRFLLGVMISAGATAYYATPMEIVIKLSIVPAALTGVLFPAFAAEVAARQAQGSQQLFMRSVHWLFCILWPLCVGLALFAHELLALWISADFAIASASLLRVFSVGILVNCLAHVPYTLIQSAGHARITALLHLAELPLFLLALWILIGHYGAMGAALAWLLRTSFETLLVFGVSARFLGLRSADLLTPSSLGVAALGLTGFVGVFMPGTTARAVWLTAVCAAAVLLAILLRSPRQSVITAP